MSKLDRKTEVNEKAKEKPRYSLDPNTFLGKIARPFALAASLVISGVSAANCTFDKTGLVPPDRPDSRPIDDGSLDGGLDAGDAGNPDADASNPDADAAPDPEICNDGIDNDGDGLTDCADHQDCDGIGACEAVESLCDDGIDNDGDGLTDCADTANCGGQPNCTEINCSDGLDSDNDGKTDCEDEDCQSQAGPNNEICEPLGESLCDDTHDNDADGLTDCDDPDCNDTPVCGENTCDDGLDNDQDGYPDCLDPDCRRFDDGDKFCSIGTAGSPSDFEMHEGNCTDGVDNDADGHTDCDDISCYITDPACGNVTPPLEICDNAVDDDGDFRIDCVQTSCALTDHCEEKTGSCTSSVGGQCGTGEIGVCAQGKCSQGLLYNGQEISRTCNYDEANQQCYEY